MKVGKAWLVSCAFAALLFAMTGTTFAQTDTIASVKQKGKLVVGVKADYKPFGYTDPSGKIVGLEIDLANDVAKRLGVQVELVPVIAANRMEFVKQGRIDLMIATMAYKPDRAEVIGIPQPYYYAGAANVFAKKNSGLKQWADYAMVLPSIDPEPWGVGVRKDDTKFTAYMSDVIKDWHKTGYLLEVEKKWGIPQSPYLVEQHDKYK